MPSGTTTRAPSKPPKAPRRRVSKSSGGPSRRFPGPRWLRAALFAVGGCAAAVLVVVLGIIFGFGLWDGPARGSVAVVDWPAGLDNGQAAAILAKLGLVRSEGAMAMFLRLTGGSSAFVPGPHLLPDALDPWDLVRVLERSSRRPTAHVTIPEGFHRFDIATRLEKLGIVSKDVFLRATTDPQLLFELGIVQISGTVADSAEGYLFPATYNLPVDSDAAEIVRRLVSESDRRFSSLTKQHGEALEKLKTRFGFGRREILTLASIVEKEAAVADERPIIAGVFLNRLEDPTFKPKRLQSDPTAMYGCYAEPDVVPACAGFTGKASGAINRDPRNRYSTYVNDGLPPGPIGNPGDSSIEAVLAPLSSKYLYFVAKGAGRHTFSETLDQHNEAVKKLRAIQTNSEKPE